MLQPTETGTRPTYKIFHLIKGAIALHDGPRFGGENFFLTPKLSLHSTNVTKSRSEMSSVIISWCICVHNSLG